VLSPVAGVVIGIDNLQMSHIARFAGAPMDKGAGVDIFKKLGEKVKKGEALYRVYAEFPSDFNFALELCERNNGYSIGEEDQVPKAFVEF